MLVDVVSKVNKQLIMIMVPLLLSSSLAAEWRGDPSRGALPGLHRTPDIYDQVV